jgi:hypothetical protein
MGKGIVEYSLNIQESTQRNLFVFQGLFQSLNNLERAVSGDISAV